MLNTAQLLPHSLHIGLTSMATKTTLDFLTKLIIIATGLAITLIFLGSFVSEDVLFFLLFFFFFKQKTAYERRLSLVGAEMYIKERTNPSIVSHSPYLSYPTGSMKTQIYIYIYIYIYI